MTDLLSDYRRKRARAEVHLEDVRRAVKPLTEDLRDPLPGEFDRDQGRYVFEYPRPLPDPDLALVVGDCVFNLRASLDYLITALVRSAGNQETHTTAFPIYVARAGESWTDVPARWASDPEDLGGKLRGAPPQTKALLEQLQPFHGVPAVYPDAHRLAILAALSNTDKHRRLNLLASRVDATFTDADGKPLYDQPVPHGTRSIPEDSKSDTQIVVLNLQPGEPESAVYLHSSHDVVFDEAGPPLKRSVVETLAGIGEFIDGRVVPTIGSLLGS